MKPAHEDVVSAGRRRRAITQTTEDAMLSGTHRNSLQEQVIYGRPTLEALTGLAAGFGAKRLMITSTAALAAPDSREAAPMRPCDRGYTHICLDVVDIVAEHKRLTEGGMTFNRTPGGLGDIKAVYGRDPDGNIVEIQETAPTHATDLTRLSVPAA